MEGAIILANALSFLVKIFRKLSRLCSCVIEQGRHTMCSDLQWCFSSDALEYKVNGNMWTDTFVCVILLFFESYIGFCTVQPTTRGFRTEHCCVCVCVYWLLFWIFMPRHNSSPLSSQPSWASIPNTVSNKREHSHTHTESKMTCYINTHHTHIRVEPTSVHIVFTYTSNHTHTYTMHTKPSPQTFSPMRMI